MLGSFPPVPGTTGSLLCMSKLDLVLRVKSHIDTKNHSMKLSLFRIRVCPDPELFGLKDPDPDPRLFQPKLKNMFLKFILKVSKLFIIRHTIIILKNRRF